MFEFRAQSELYKIIVMSSSEDSYDYESYCVECYEKYDHHWL
jgi:hypothetical protein